MQQRKHSVAHGAHTDADRQHLFCQEKRDKRRLDATSAVWQRREHGIDSRLNYRSIIVNANSGVTIVVRLGSVTSLNFLHACLYVEAVTCHMVKSVLQLCDKTQRKQQQ